MQAVKLSPLHQVEYAVKDLDYSMQFFAKVFGEGEVESTFSRVLTNPALDIRHAGFGKTVQQLCQPLMEGLPHSTAVQEWGNCVHNLCFLVENIDAIAANCHEAGLEALIEFPMGDNWRQLLAEDNIQGNHQSYIFDTRAVFGFQLELAETPWRVEPEPPIMLPAYGPQWAAVGADAGNTLRGINVLVKDLESTLHALQSVFAGSVSLLQPPGPSGDEGCHFMVVELGQVRLAYIQPVSSGALARLLKQRGPTVHSLLAEVADMGHVAASLSKLNIRTGEPEGVLLSAFGEPNALQSSALQAHSMAELGVEFVLIPVQP
jgi:Glyoxalase/Bleomycin resistance protein/Dioxygenase superfamily